MADLINPKVTYATGGSLGGYTVGKAVSVLMLHYWIQESAPDVVLAIEYLTELVCTGLGAFVLGYFKGAQGG